MFTKASGVAIVSACAVFLCTALLTRMGGTRTKFLQPEMPVPVAQVFERACKDCHSNRTEWPWYAKIPPLSLAIAADVNRGRQFFNMSEWQHYTSGRKRGFLSAIAVDVRRGKMPPRTYTWLHRGSILTARDRALLEDWATEEAQRLRFQFPSVANRNPGTTR